MRLVALATTALLLAACADEPPVGAGVGGGASAGDGGAGGGASAGGMGGASTGPPWLDDFPARRRIVFHPTLAQDLLDFPVPVVLQRDAHVAARGTDSDAFAFTDADGTTLRHLEVELFDAAAGTLVVWLRVPALLPGDERSGYLYYGDPNPTVNDGTRAWREGFASVWHFGDDPASSPLVRDSVRANHGAPDPTPPTRVPGIAGFALAFAGLDGDGRVVVPDPADGSLDFGFASFSWSHWVYVEATNGTYDTPFHKGGSNPADNGYWTDLGNGWTAVLADDDENPGASFGAAALERWIHLAAVVDRQKGELRTYADGLPIAQVSIGSLGTLSGDDAVTFGGHYPFTGIVDEPRVYGWALSDAWIAAEHACLDDPASFYTVEAPEDR